MLDVQFHMLLYYNLFMKRIVDRNIVLIAKNGINQKLS